MRAACLEPLGKPKDVLGPAFQHSAHEYKYHGPPFTDMVFQKLYDLAAVEGQPGATAHFDNVPNVELAFATPGRQAEAHALGKRRSTY